MTFRTTAAAAALLLAVSAASAQAKHFDATVTNTHNTADPGLKVATKTINSTLSFDLAAVGDTYTAPLFKLSADESAINADDYSWSTIAVDFGFTSPASGSGEVGGYTHGDTGYNFLGLPDAHEYGVVGWWNSQDVFELSDGTMLGVSLNSGDFSDGQFYGLSTGASHGLKVSATFTLLPDCGPTPAAPEPGTWALMMAGVGLAGAALRRRRAATLAAA